MANGHELAAKYGQVFKPDYRVKFLAADGSVLVPRAGSAHSDPFQVTTEADPPVGWKPYLTKPEGRRGQFDLKSGHTEQGEIQFKVVDARLGIGNAQRWVTAFLADAQGYNAFKNIKVSVLETLNGVDWHDYFTGIVSISEAPDVFATGPYYVFTVQDYRVQEYRKIFVGPPHRSVTYAMPAPLFPIGVPKIQESTLAIGFTVGWNELESAPAYPVVAKTTPNGQLYLHTGIVFTGDAATYYNERPGRLFATEDLASAADPTSATSPLAKRVGTKICTNLRLKIRLYQSTDPFKEALVTPVSTAGMGLRNVTGYDGATNASPVWIDKLGMVNGFGVVALPSDHPDYFAITAGQTYEIYAIDTGAPSTNSPLLIGAVDAKVLWQDIADGKFGFLDDDGEVIGQPLPLNATDFAAFPTTKKVRFAITGAADLQQFLENELFKTCFISARVNYDGTISPIKTGLDYSEDAPVEIPVDEIISNDWKHGEDVMSSVNIEATTYGFQDEVDLELKAEHAQRVSSQSGGLYSNQNGGGFITKTQTFSYPGARAAQLANEPETIQIRGLDLPVLFKFAEDPSDPTIPVIGLPLFDSGSAIQPYQEVAQNFLNWFEDGAAKLQLTCRRSGVAETVRQGDFITVNADSLPNPSTNQRGGTRYGIVLERAEKGETVELLFLDAGPNSSPISATVGNPTLTVENEESYPTIVVTLNASGNRAQLQFASTPTSQLTAPAENDPAWLSLAFLDASDTVTLRQVFHDKRIWFRVRSERATDTALPSGWAFPATPYIDVEPIARASNLALAFDANGEVDVTFNLNNVATGARVYYNVHAEGATPVYTDYVDVTVGSVHIAVTVPVEQEISVKVVPQDSSGNPRPSLERALLRENLSTSALSIEYASDATGSNEDSVFNPAIHTYARWSEDDGATWTVWFKIVGEDGSSAEGRYRDYIFCIAPIGTTPATPTGDPPTSPGVTWVGSPPTYDVTTHVLWMSSADRDGATDALISATWDVPVRLTGAQGTAGIKGDKGDPGVAACSVKITVTNPIVEPNHVLTITVFPTTATVSATVNGIIKTLTNLGNGVYKYTLVRQNLVNQNLLVQASANGYAAGTGFYGIDRDPTPGLAGGVTVIPVMSGAAQTGWLVRGSADDDAKQIGVATQDGGLAVSLSTPALTGGELNTASTKTFSLTLTQNPGTVATLTLTPKDGTTSGEPWIMALGMPPRTTETVTDMSNAVRRITLQTNPGTSRIFVKAIKAASGAPVATYLPNSVGGLDRSTASTAQRNAVGPSLTIFVDLAGVGDNVLIQYYAVADTTEEVHEFLLDEDDEPESTITATGVNNVIAVVLTHDDDVVKWRLWASRLTWPTADGTITRDANGRITTDPYGPPLDEGNRHDRQPTWWATEGVWNLLLRAYDYSGNYVTSDYSLTVQAGASTAAELTNVATARTDNATGNDYHVFTWSHSAAITSTSGHTVRVMESGVSKSQVGASTNTTQVVSPEQKLSTDANSVYRKYEYTLQLIDSGGNVVSSYPATIEGYYDDGTVTVAAPTETPGGLTLSSTNGTVTANWVNFSNNWEIQIEWWKDSVAVTTLTLAPSTRSTSLPYEPGSVAEARVRYNNAGGPGPWTDMSNPVTA